MDKDLALSVIDSHVALSSLRDEWNRLLDDSSAQGVCLRWEWLHTWWEIYAADNARLCVLLVRENGGRLVGLAPFYVQIEKKFGLGVRTLRFLGTGEAESEEVASEYLDIAALRGFEERVAQRVWEFLRGARCWDQLVFNDVLNDSLVLATLRQFLEAERIFVVSERVGVRYSVGVPPNWEEYIARLGPGAAKRLPYKRRKLERAGHVTMKTVTRPEEMDQAFEELVRLHQLRWQTQGAQGVFASTRFTDYHRRLMRMLLARGELRLRFLSLDGVNIAVLYNLRHKDTEYFYQGGSDMGRASKHSPGLVAHLYAIESAIHDGLKQYDFMKGGTDSYKTDFGCEESPMHDMRVFARSWRGRILALEAWARRRWLAFQSSVKAGPPSSRGEVTSKACNMLVRKPLKFLWRLANRVSLAAT